MASARRVAGGVLVVMAGRSSGAAVDRDNAGMQAVRFVIDMGR
jgi:hypothetical protein